MGLAPIPDYGPILDGVRVLDPDGDVILTVGTAPRQSKIQVNSGKLERASQYFAALFSANFAEGQQLRNDNKPVSITLHGDDIEGMELVLMLIHSGWLPCLTMERINNMVDVAKKYALVEAISEGLSEKINVWLGGRHEACDMVLLGDIITAAYIFDASHAFTIATRQFVKYTTGSVTKLDGCLHSDDLPAMVFVALSEQRGVVAEYIIRQLVQLSRTAGACAKCEVGYNRFFANMAKSFDVWNWPPLTGGFSVHSHSNSRLLNNLLGLIDAGLSSFAPRDCDDAECANIVPEDEIRRIHSHAEKLLGKMCLKCVKLGVFLIGNCLGHD